VIINTVGITFSSLQFVFCISLIFPTILRQTGMWDHLLKCCSGFPYTGVHMGESHLWLESHSQHTTGWFPGLITPVDSAQGAPSLTGPFWKHTGWCLNRHTQGAVETAISFCPFLFFQSFLSLLPLLCRNATLSNAFGGWRLTYHL